MTLPLRTHTSTYIPTAPSTTKVDLVEKQEIILLLYSLTNIDHVEKHNLKSNLDLDFEMVITS